MADPSVFDPATFVHSPAINIHTGITLGQTLFVELPKGMPQNVIDAAEDLGTTVADAQNALADSLRIRGIVSDSDSRTIDAEADRSWKALRMRVTACSMIPDTHNPHAARAAEIDTMLFGDNNLDFLQFTYPEQWPSMETLLKRIDDEHLAIEIDQIAGPEYLRQIRDVHPRYQVMVQAQLTRTDEPGPDLRIHVRALAAAIVDYANKVAATVNKRKPETAVVARKALRPIEAHREMLARRQSSTSAPDSTPAEAPATAEAASKTA